MFDKAGLTVRDELGPIKLNGNHWDVMFWALN